MSNMATRSPIVLFFGCVSLATAGAFGAGLPDAHDLSAPDRVSTAGAGGHGQHDDVRSSMYGHPIAPHDVDRIVKLNPGRRYVTVTNGEAILFRAGEKGFAWKFTPTLHHRSFDLSEIAPKGIDVRGIRVYCVPDLYERSG